MRFLETLERLHAGIKPRNYIEIGARDSRTLCMAGCTSIAVSRDLVVTDALEQPTRLFKTSGAAFFARHDLVALAGGPVDLAVLHSGATVAETLRTIGHLEACMSEHGVIVLAGIFGAGNPSLVPLLTEARPQLSVRVFDVEGDGIALLSGFASEGGEPGDALADLEPRLRDACERPGSVAHARAGLKAEPVEALIEHLSSLSAAVPGAGSGSSDGGDYLDLLKRSLLNEVYLDDELRLLYLRACIDGNEQFDYSVYHDIRERRSEAYEALKASRQIGQFLNRNIHNCGFSHTMIGRERLEGLHGCLDIIRRTGVDGDFMECGVWRGGACIFMAGYLKAHAMAGRRVILADSFEGVPKSSVAQDEGIDLDKERYPELAVSEQAVRDNFAAYGLLRPNVEFIKGWFSDTLAKAPVEKLALLRLDGDLYESTMDALKALYDKVEPGGIVVVDDYGVLPCCREAVEDFFEQRGEAVPELVKIDWSGVYWIKPEDRRRSAASERGFRTAFPMPFLEHYQSGALTYSYKGVRCLKGPIDIAIYMKALWELKPKLILEIGSHSGGSALLLADIVSAYGLDTRIVSVDQHIPSGVDDPRITFVEGDVADLATVFDTLGLRDISHPWFVTEDSAHTYEACRAALEFLSGEMESGDLLAMEDGVLDDLGMSERYNGGPNRAIGEFLDERPGVFEIDTELCDMFGHNATYAPNGYLRRV